MTSYSAFRNIARANWSSLAVCILLIAVTWIVFGQTTRHEFVNYDDNTYVYANPVVRSGVTVYGTEWAFTHVHSQNWHPLTTLSHMLDCQIFGLNAAGHHFTNVLLHTAAVVLLFLVLFQMTGAIWRSGFVAAVFAIHPLHVESVAWIAERKDVLSALFFMLTLAAYASYVRNRSIGRYLAVSILFALGLMSKPMLVTVPFVLLLLDYWPLERGQTFAAANPSPRRRGGSERQSATPHPSLSPSQGERIKVRGSYRVVGALVVEKIPWFLLAAASCVATIVAQRQATGSAEELPLSWRAENALVAAATYVWQTFWPANLTVFYPHPENQLALWQIILAAGLLAGLTLPALMARRRFPYLFTGWFWYLIMLFPVIGLVQVGLQGHADRYTYLPQIGLGIMATWAIADLTSGWRARMITLACAGSAVLVALSLCAWKQVGYWKNSETLWTHALAVTSHNDVAEAGLGGILLGRGKIDEAISNFREALRIRPNNPEVHRSLAQALAQEGNLTEAIVHWEKALELQPEDVTARDSLGAVLAQQGRLAEAVAQWQQSLQYDPGDGNALSNLGWVLSTAPEDSMRNGPQALEFARRASQVAQDNNPMILRTLAAAYAENGQFPEAIDAANRGVQIALEQQNPALAEELRRNITLYRAKAPLRDNGLTNVAPQR
jgi:tetratricopeptide (TPR) repeat protein